MGYLSKLTIAALLSALSAPSAMAQKPTDFPERQFGMWSVYGYKGTCWMLVRKGVNGTILNFSMRINGPKLLVGAENRDWTWLNDPGNYTAELELGAASGTVNVVTKIDDSLGPLLATFVAGDSFALLRNTSRAALTLDGKRMFDIPLGDKRAAVDYLEECARTLGSGPYSG